MDGTTNIIELKGIGEKSATAFGRLGIRDVDSLITMYPKYYLTYEDPKDVNEIEIGQRVQYAIFKETITSGKRLYIYGNSDL